MRLNAFSFCWIIVVSLIDVRQASDLSQYLTSALGGTDSYLQSFHTNHFMPPPPQFRFLKSKPILQNNWKERLYRKKKDWAKRDLYI